MIDTYHLDYETYSEVDLKKLGAFRYAADPSTEILIMAIARNDEPVEVWDTHSGGVSALALLAEAIADPNALIYAHNAQFEHAISRELLHKRLGFEIPLEKWRCTAAMCRLGAIPSSLAKAGDFLDIIMPKDKEGMRLIKKFSIPRKPTKADPRTRIMPPDDLADWNIFVEYCRRDVEAEREIHGKLTKDFELTGWALESFQLDMEMNARGIPVNRKALEHASTLMEEYLTMKVPEFRKQVATAGVSLTLPVTTTRKETKDVDITDGFNPTQRELFMVWLANRGWTPPDLTADTVAAKLADPGDLSEQGQTALHTYSLISSAAVKKIPAMLAMACADGYVRGALMVFGAERTHRWTGKGVQPQNFARPRIKFTELAYDLICQGATLDEIESICGDFFDVLVSVIRHFIQPHEGDCLQADYSSIEARVAPWLVGEQETLDMFERGEPIYEMMAQKIFGGKLEDITSEQRFVGKQAVLGCSYNMGAPKFRGTCESYGFEPSTEMVREFGARYVDTNQKVFKEAERMKWNFEKHFAGPKSGIDMPSMYSWSHFLTEAEKNLDLKPDPCSEEEWIDAAYDDLAERAVQTWRESNPAIVSSWRDLDSAAKKAIQSPKTTHTVGKLQLRCQKVGGFDALLIKLPSGHKLVYPNPKVVNAKGWGTEITFYGVIPNSGGRWGTCRTYGGKLLENATQATAGDVMRHGMKCAEDAGYQTFMLVHDEILTLITDPDQTHEELCDLLCHQASWMKGLPLAAEGGQLPFYKK